MRILAQRGQLRAERPLGALLQQPRNKSTGVYRLSIASVKSVRRRALMRGMDAKKRTVGSPRQPQPTLAERRAACAIRVTLDGQPASICGARLPFARVVAESGRRVHEWEWATALAVVRAGGDFRS